MARRIFDYLGYPCDPHDLTNDAWYYVQKEGVTLCHRVKGQPGEIVVIPWSKVKRAIADHEKAPGRRQKVTNGDRA